MSRVLDLCVEVVEHAGLKSAKYVKAQNYSYK